jgi:hypothetical protein
VLTCTFLELRWYGSSRTFVRVEEVVGSNPATPTRRALSELRF